MVFTDRHAGGINYPKGGVGTIAEKLVTGIQNLGGKIRYKANVTEILLKDKTAVGVTLSNGEKLYSNIIVSNSTRWDTFGLKDNTKGLIQSKNVPKSEYKWSETYKPSPSFVSIHLGVERNLISDNFSCHHIIVDNWDELESEKGVIFVSIPTLLDSSLAPEGKHIVHAFTPSSMSEWQGLSRKKYLDKKEKYFHFLLKKYQLFFLILNKILIIKKLVRPKLIKSFLEDMKVVMGQFPEKSCLAFCQCLSTLQKLKTFNV